MSIDLCLIAIKNQDRNTQYEIDLINVSSQDAVRISEADDSYNAYCNHIRELDELYEWEPEPIHLWDVNQTEEMRLLSITALFNNINYMYVVGYKKASDTIIESLDIQIKWALDKGFKLNWYAW